MDPLYLQDYLVTILGQQRREFVNYGPRGKNIVGQRALDLLALLCDPAKFLLKCSGSISEPLSAGWATSIELGVMPQEAVPSLASSSESPKPTCRSCGEACLFPASLLGKSLLRFGRWGVHLAPP
jgi:hypothetical protein